jgi:ABC-type transport system involved in multi-copper enzyme maturation permease subunit
MPVAALVSVGTKLLEQFGISAFLSTFGLFGMLSSLALGTFVASEEFADKTVQFLFSKPRSRAYFIWAGWAVGCLELLLIALVNLSAGWLTLSHYANPFHSTLFGSTTGHDIVTNIIDGLILFLFVYCLTFALTALLRNGLKGLGASMAITFGLPCFAIAVRWRWKVDMPIPTNHIGGLPIVISNGVWILVALLFVFAAQLVVERTEI